VPRERKPLTPHEQDVLDYLIDLEGVTPGFPDNPTRLENYARAIAVIVATESKLKSNIGRWTGGKPDCSHTPGEATPYAKFAACICTACGAERRIIPAEWLIREIQQRCNWWPTPIQVREIYTEQFTPEDGIDHLKEAGGRRRAAGNDD